MNNCRFCKNPLTHEFIDLFSAPPSNAFLKKSQLNEPETYFPLRLFTCDKCYLVQLDEYESAKNIFNENYVYFSSFSKSWLAHCETYVDSVVSRFELNEKSKILELASNDGYLLDIFKRRGLQVLGVEPTASTALVAQQKGVDTLVRFFTVDCAREIADTYGQSDLIAANNVLAHVPDLHDFVRGISIALKESGTFTGEFPHLYQLVKNCQFDTIYHEHFSYFSLMTLRKIFAEHKMTIFDAEEIPTHGGSLRIYASLAKSLPETERMLAIAEKEKAAGMETLDFYSGFQETVNEIKREFLSFLLDARSRNKKVMAYGAAAKGNTLLNFCGVKSDLLSFVTDASPHKQNLFLPGSHIPVLSPTVIPQYKPDYVVLLPWNLREEITADLNYIKEWGGKFVVAIPKLEVL